MKFVTSQEVTLTAAEHFESIPGTTAAERAVADLMPIDVPREEARPALERVCTAGHRASLPLA